MGELKLEDRVSKEFYKLNQEYLNVFYSKEYQKLFRKDRIYKRLNLLKCALKEKEFMWIIFWFIRKNNKRVNVYMDTSIKYNRKNLKNKKIAIYTCISGKYDKVNEPAYISKQCDYYIYTDNDLNPNSIWQKKSLSSITEIENLTNLERARYIKTHPHLLFKEYDYSIWVDGNIKIMADLLPLVSDMGDHIMGIHKHPSRDCVYDEMMDIILLKKAVSADLKKQLKLYQEEGFPKKYGQFETNVIITNLKKELCKNIYQDWWNEISKYTKRDQMSFTYVLWKNHVKSKDIYLLGNNTRLNPRFRVFEHTKM